MVLGKKLVENGEIVLKNNQELKTIEVPSNLEKWLI